MTYMPNRYMKSNWKPYAALVALCFLWGTTYLGIKIGVEDGFPPFLFSGLRFVISGLLIIAGGKLAGWDIFPAKAEFKRILVSGLFIFTGGNLFLVLAEQSVSSGLAALVNAAFPLWIVIITRIWNPTEKTPLITFVGILVGFVGQWMIFYDHLIEIGQQVNYFGLILLVWGLANGAFGSIHMKKYPVNLNPAITGAWQMLLSGLVTTFIGLYEGEWSSLPTHLSGWWSMIYLIVAGSILGYSLFVYALRYLPAQQVSVYAYVNPIVAVFLGWLLLKEKISPMAIYAMFVTMIGVYLVNRGMSAARKKG